MIRTIAFDFLGTLADEDKGFESFFDKKFIKNIYLEQRKIITSQDYRPFSEILKKAIKTVIDRDYHTIFRRMVLFPNTMEILSKLKTKHKIIILTNCDNKLVNFVIDKYKFDFGRIITSEDLRTYKPNKNNYEKIVDLSSTKKENVVYVTSSSWDSMGSKDFGFKTIFLDRTDSGLGGIPKRIYPDYVIKDLAELLKLSQFNE